MKNLVDINNLFVEYTVNKGVFEKKQTIHAVNDVSLEIKKGEILAIAGESGCGKSTLAKALLNHFMGFQAIQISKNTRK